MSTVDVTLVKKFPGITTLSACAGLRRDDNVLILVNTATADIGHAISAECRDRVADIEVVTVPDLEIHGQEPPDEIRNRMGHATLIFGLTEMSLAHTQARQAAGRRGARYLSLPNYSWETLMRPALQVDFNAIEPLAQRLAGILTNANTIRVTSSAGTDLTLAVGGRRANAAPGTCFQDGGLASPPDAEVNIPPLETQSFGIIVVDGSIPCPQIGLINSRIEMTIENGRVSKISGGDQARVLESIYASCGWPNARMLAEFGLGLNPKAVLTGSSMLEDEGVLGTAHFGFGANSALGGVLSLPFHLDHIVTRVTVVVDGQIIMNDGKLEVE